MCVIRNRKDEKKPEFAIKRLLENAVVFTLNMFSLKQ